MKLVQAEPGYVLVYHTRLTNIGSRRAGKYNVKLLSSGHYGMTFDVYNNRNETVLMHAFYSYNETNTDVMNYKTSVNTATYNCRKEN